jgi:hypothetical protein
MQQANERELQITKLDAARRQLSTAIRLYFHQADAVSIHTLTAAAYELLKDINRQRGGAPMYVKEALLQNIKPELQAEFARKINEAENFFKHADRDSQRLLTFRPAQTDLMIYDACCKYYDLTGDTVVEFGAFKSWAALTWAKGFVAKSFPPDFTERLALSFPTDNAYSFYKAFMAEGLRLFEPRDG